MDLRCAAFGRRVALKGRLIGPGVMRSVTIRLSPNGLICDKVADDQQRLIFGWARHMRETPL
jgi:hypothetical protein